MTKFVYFSWVREMVGAAEEEFDLPPDVRTVSDVVNFLRGQEDGHRAAMEHEGVIRFALDQEAADADDPVTGVREIAIFPPMTGG